MVGALTLDSPPLFGFLGNYVNRARKPEVSQVLSQSLGILRAVSPSLEDVCSILESMSLVTKLAAGKPPGRLIGDNEVGHTLGAVAHNLCNLPRHTIEGQNARMIVGLSMREALRLASLLFLTAPINHISGRISGHLNHRGRLPKLLRSHSLDWSGLEELELWVLVIGALAELGADREWMVAHIRDIMHVKGLDWKGVSRALSQIAWTDCVSSEDIESLREELEQVHHNTFHVL